MNIIDYLKDIPGFNNLIVIDQSATWGKSIYELMDSSKTELKKYLEEKRRIEKIRNRASRPINIYEEKWNSVVKSINDNIENKNIIGFHCTRLMDCEIDDILKKGLTPLNNDFANIKIDLAYKKGFIPLELKYKLTNKDEYSEESNRPNRVHLTHNTKTLRQEMGFFKFFRFWGGEAVYSGFEDKQCLQKIGVPCIIIACVEFQDLIDLNISQRLISIFLKNSYFYDHEFDSEILHTVKAIAVIKMNDPLFNQLTNCNNWYERIN